MERVTGDGIALNLGKMSKNIMLDADAGGVRGKHPVLSVKVGWLWVLLVRAELWATQETQMRPPSITVGWRYK